MNIPSFGASVDVRSISLILRIRVMKASNSALLEAFSIRRSTYGCSGANTT